MRLLPLVQAVHIRSGQVISLAGAGGKSSLLFSLAAALVAEGKRVITTTTTKIYPPTERECPTLLLVESNPDPIAAIAKALLRSPHVTAASRRAEGKLHGIEPKLVDQLNESGIADLVIVEADGAAGRPLKAAKEGEPVFPASSDVCVIVMGIEALGKPLDEAWVFRATLAGQITGLKEQDPITPEAAAELLIGDRGIACRAPPASSLIVFLNKVETDGHRAAAYDLGRLVLERYGERLIRVVIGSLSWPEPGFAVLER